LNRVPNDAEKSWLAVEIGTGNTAAKGLPDVCGALAAGMLQGGCNGAATERRVGIEQI
jgi:hypothetical protein